MANEFHIKITLEKNSPNTRSSILPLISADFPEDFPQYDIPNSPFNICFVACLFAKKIWDKLKQTKGFKRNGFFLKYYFNTECKDQFETTKRHAFIMNTPTDLAFSLVALMIKSFEIHFKKINKTKEHSPEVLLALDKLNLAAHENFSIEGILEEIELRRKNINKNFASGKRDLLDQIDSSRIEKRESVKINSPKKVTVSNSSAEKLSGDLESYLKILGEPNLPKKKPSLIVQT